MVYVCIHVPFTKARETILSVSGEINKYTAGLIRVWRLYTDGKLLWRICRTWQHTNFAPLYHPPTSECILTLPQPLSTCLFWRNIKLHSNLIYIKGNQKFTSKLDVYLRHYPVAFVLLFSKKHGFEIKRREKLPSNTFPILSAWRKYPKRNIANWR